MTAIKLSYSTFGLSNLDFLDAITAVDKAGYEGMEISFHRQQFNPFNIDDAYLAAVKKRFAASCVKPACVATASHFFDPHRPHEPSLLALEKAGRKRRIDLIKRGIHVARQLGVNLVTFGSGFIRDEHVAAPHINPGELLVDSIQECLREIRADEDMTLLIEPEPGMYIETLAQGLELLQQVGSEKFKLHIDICHAYCSEADYVHALAQAAPQARYLHISDAPAGYKLKIAHDHPDLAPDLAKASLLVHFPDTADFLLLDKNHPIHFYEALPTPARRQRMDTLLTQAGIKNDLQPVAYASLYAGASALDDELFTYLISVPGLSYDVLERARPVLAYLRGVNRPALVQARMANTLTGIAHFHEIPGRGALDFAASFKALGDNGFRGYGTVELYHHVDDWQQALLTSQRYLAPLLATN